MKTPNGKTRILMLLVEDNPGDSDLFLEMFSPADRERYDIEVASLLSEAMEKMRQLPIDVVVLDLGLPDCTGVESVKLLRHQARDVPIVVLTGFEDEKLAIECIDAGAQDYLVKSEVRAHSLKRAIGYAMMRQREAKIRELQDQLERYRAMSSSAQGTTVTAALAGTGAVSMRHPETFARVVEEYFALLQPYLSHETDRVDAPRPAMERIVTTLGDAGGGPRDLLDMHVSALDRAIAVRDNAHTRSLVVEARLLALAMMGILVDYYRVGHRRRFE